MGKQIPFQENEGKEILKEFLEVAKQPPVPKIEVKADKGGIAVNGNNNTVIVNRGYNWLSILAVLVGCTGFYFFLFLCVATFTAPYSVVGLVVISFYSIFFGLLTTGLLIEIRPQDFQLKN